MANSDNETSPLLGPSPSSAPPPTRLHNARKQLRLSLEFVQRKKVRLLACVIVLLFLCSSGDLMLVIPRLRLYELLVCQDYYDKHDTAGMVHRAGEPIDERLCKIPAIQSEVAKLVGWGDSLAALFGLTVAMYFGTLADRIGRKWVLAMALLGSILPFVWIPFVCYYHNVFPIRLVWVGAAFYLIGGGGNVSNSIFFTMLSDIFDPTERTQVLYYLGALSNVTGFFAPPLGTWLMKHSIWLPWQVVILMSISGLGVVAIMPETMAQESPAAHVPSNETDYGTEPGQGGDQESASGELPAARKSRFAETRDWVYDTFHPLMIPGLLYCGAVYLFEWLAKSAAQLYPQYASNKYSLKLEQTGWLLSIGPLEATVITAVVLPGLTALNARKIRLPSMQFNKLVVQGCLLIITVGSLCVFLADRLAVMAMGVVVYGLGSTFGAPLQALASSFVDRHHMARMFTVLSIITTIGTAVSPLMMAGLLSAGVKLGGLWIGLPYLVGCILYLVAFMAASGIRVRPQEAESEE